MTDAATHDLRRTVPPASDSGRDRRTVRGRQRVSVRALQITVAVAIVPVAAVAITLAVTSDHVEKVTATALYRVYMAVVPMVIGLYWWRRRPASRFGPWLIAFGLGYFMVSWQSADWPLLFGVGYLSELVVSVLTFQLLLSFPSGRLETRADRAWMGVFIAVNVAFYAVLVLGMPVLTTGAVLSQCVPACPDNVLQVVSNPDLVQFLRQALIYAILALVVVAFVLYATHLRAASRPRRRALVAVAATSLLFLPVFFAYHFSRVVLEADPATLEAMQWVLLVTRVLLPLGFLFALFQADLLAGAARGRLLEELASGPSPHRWRGAVARALDDPALRMAYWDPASARYREADGTELAPPVGEGRAWHEIARDGRPVAALDVDAVLAEDPELVQAASSATILAIENGSLEGDLRDAQARIVAAGDDARRRIERDLHDSAQQRLVALRIHLALAGEQLDGPEQRAMVERLAAEVEEALDDLRNVARGVYPALLRGGGLAAALRAVSRHAGLPVTVAGSWEHRHDEQVELAAYFCCLEAIQNAAKHAGNGASATVRLSENNGNVRFAVEDDGAGFDPAAVQRGAGLANMTDRMSALGGTLRIESAIGHGTRVAGELPA